MPLTNVRVLQFIIATSPGMSVSFGNVPTTELLACECMCVGNEKQRICLGSNNALIIRKVHPRTGHEDPEGEKRYSCILLTSALGGGGWSTPRSDRFTPGKDPVPIV